MNWFREAVGDERLMDLGFSRGDFTLYNGREGKIRPSICK